MNRYKTLILVLAALVLAGCASSPPPVVEAPPADGNVALVKVFYATDRNILADPGKAGWFGTDRSSEVNYGTCIVSLPRGDREGDMERTRLWRVTRDDARKDEEAVAETLLVPKGDYLKALSERIRGSEGRSALVFVHGFNVTFEEAAVRTAKLVYNLSFDGAALFFSWPSKGSMFDYFADENTIEWATPDLKSFLKEVLTAVDAENVYFIAHSMGTRGFVKALTSVLGENPGLKKKIKEVVLAAPDMDAEVFKRDYAPALANAGRHVTLYSASDDLALSLSKKIHAFARAGDAGEGLLIAPGIETVDVNAVDSGPLHHSYVFEDPQVKKDLFYIIKNGMRADVRAGLYGIETPAGRYWKFSR